MNIRIYQVNMKRDTNNVAFMRYELLEKLQGSQSVDSKIYDKVFDGEVDCQTLEDVYQMFNLNHPEGYKDRSLSVSDVVEVMEDPMHPHCFYFCDSIGFKPIDFEPKDCQLGRTFTDTEKKNMISVLLIEPNKYPKMIEIEDSLEAMQKIVGGDIEEYMPFEDEVAIICNDESKMNGMLPNRAVYAEPETVEMSYQEMTKRFREAENNRKEHLTGYVVFTEDSFDKPYSEESRTYVISSNNKAFQSGMGGYSIYASCLDGTDPCLRLDGYMSAEHGGENGWKIEKCYMKENSREMLDIIFGQFFIAYAPIESENFQSLPKNLAEKYKEKFKYPERIAKVNGEIVPFLLSLKPKKRNANLKEKRGNPESLHYLSCIILASRLFLLLSGKKQ